MKQALQKLRRRPRAVRDYQRPERGTELIRFEHLAKSFAQ
jgi:hypothetical protein